MSIFDTLYGYGQNILTLIPGQDSQSQPPQSTLPQSSIPAPQPTTRLPGADFTNAPVSAPQPQPVQPPFSQDINLYVPASERAQREVPVRNIVYDPIGGGFGGYQVPPRSEPGFTRIYGGIATSGSTGTLQSGMVSLTPLSPVVYTQEGRATLAPSARPEYAAIVLAAPERFSRLGAEAYGGYVQPLDTRTIQSTGAQMGRYPEASGNLANLVDPYGVNRPKQEWSILPWSVDTRNAPRFQTLGPEGVYGVPSAGGLAGIGLTPEQNIVPGRPPNYFGAGVTMQRMEVDPNIRVAESRMPEPGGYFTFPSGQRLFILGEAGLKALPISPTGQLSLGIPSEKPEPQNLTGKPLPLPPLTYESVEKAAGEKAFSLLPKATMPMLKWTGIQIEKQGLTPEDVTLKNLALHPENVVFKSTIIPAAGLAHEETMTILKATKEKPFGMAALFALSAGVPIVLGVAEPALGAVGISAEATPRLWGAGGTILKAGVITLGTGYAVSATERITGYKPSGLYGVVGAPGYPETGLRKVEDIPLKEMRSRALWIGTTEVAPIMAGFEVGTAIAPKLYGLFTTRGAEYVPYPEIGTVPYKEGITPRTYSGRISELELGGGGYPLSPVAKNYEVMSEALRTSSIVDVPISGYGSGASGKSVPQVQHVPKTSLLPKEGVVELSETGENVFRYWHASPSLRGAQTETVLAGSSELPGKWVSPTPEEYFLKIGQGMKVEPFSANLPVGAMPSFERGVVPFVERAPGTTFEILSGKVQPTRGGLYIPPTAKLELEAVMSEGTVTKLTGARYYTEIGGIRIGERTFFATRVPIYERTTFGVTQPITPPIIKPVEVGRFSMGGIGAYEYKGATVGAAGIFSVAEVTKYTAPKYEPISSSAQRYEPPAYYKPMKYEAPKYEPPAYYKPTKYEPPSYYPPAKYVPPYYKPPAYEPPYYKSPPYEPPYYKPPAYEPPPYYPPTYYPPPVYTPPPPIAFPLFSGGFYPHTKKPGKRQHLEFFRIGEGIRNMNLLGSSGVSRIKPIRVKKIKF
ncbi:MAG: hypothetical protein MUO73_03455 [Thermoplasmata archaeon]|nr:hypothetical protein [Thermoplasmata archaeon]